LPEKTVKLSEAKPSFLPSRQQREAQGIRLWRTAQLGCRFLASSFRQVKEEGTHNTKINFIIMFLLLAPKGTKKGSRSLGPPEADFPALLAKNGRHRNIAP